MFDRLAIERRLENWGRWSTVGNRPKGRSSLYGIMVAAGYRQEYADVPSSRAFDERDAWLIDCAWRSLPECEEKEFLVERYVWKRSGDRALRFIRRRDREAYRFRALCMIQRAADRLNAECENDKMGIESSTLALT